MELQRKRLGKIGFTCDGEWNPNNEYDRLCVVHDDNFASYASKKPVPKGILLSDRNYWQPMCKLNEHIVMDYNNFKKDIINSVITKISDYLKSDAFELLLESKIRTILVNRNVIDKTV